MIKNTEPHEIWMLLCYDERTQKHSDFECETKEEAQSLINKGIESCPIHSFVRNVYVDTCARRVRVYENTPSGEKLIMSFFMYRDRAQEWCNDMDCVITHLNELEERMDEAETDIVAQSNRLNKITECISNLESCTVSAHSHIRDLEYKLCKENVGSLYGMQAKDIANCEELDKRISNMGKYFDNILKNMCKHLTQLEKRVSDIEFPDEDDNYPF